MRSTILFVAGLVIMGLSQVAVAQEFPTEADLKKGERKAEYLPYVDQHFPNRVFGDDTHHHSNFSFDDGLMGTKLTPEESYRFARGEELISNTGLRARLSRPLDFLVVSDQAEYIGLAEMLSNAAPDLLSTEAGKRWYDKRKVGGPEATQVALEVL